MNAGYYRLNDGVFQYGKNIYGPNFTLLEKDRDNYLYPNEANGWSWFNSEDEARSAFGLPGVGQISAPGYNPSQFLQEMFSSTSFEAWMNNFSSFKQTGFANVATNAKIDNNWTVMQSVYNQFKAGVAPSQAAIDEWQGYADANGVPITF